MNGSLNPLLFWLLSAAATAIATLSSALVLAHIKLDDERARLAIKSSDELKAHVEKELKELQDRLHRYANMVNEITTRLRWQDEDRVKGE